MVLHCSILLTDSLKKVYISSNIQIRHYVCNCGKPHERKEVIEQQGGFILWNFEQITTEITTRHGGGSQTFMSSQFNQLPPNPVSKKKIFSKQKSHNTKTPHSHILLHVCWNTNHNREQTHHLTQRCY
jgi:hypothetical protein